MNNIATEHKFCVDCRWCRQFLFVKDRCLHPQVNAENAKYLATGNPKEAVETYHGRIFRDCHYKAQLFEPR